jgi:hypothetical protein
MSQLLQGCLYATDGVYADSTPGWIPAFPRVHADPDGSVGRRGNDMGRGVDASLVQRPAL